MSVSSASSEKTNPQIVFQVNYPFLGWGTALVQNEQVVISSLLEGEPPAAPHVVLIDATIRSLYEQQVTQMMTNPDAPLMGYVPPEARWGWYRIERNWALIGVLPSFATPDGVSFSELSCLIPHRAANVLAWWQICRAERKRYARTLAIECYKGHLELYLFSEKGLVWVDSQQYEVSLPSLHDPERYPSIAAQYIEPVWFSLLERGRITPEQIQALTLCVPIESPFLPGWRDFLVNWFPSSIQNFFQTPSLPLTLITPEKYLVNAEGEGIPYLPLSLWSAIRQFNQGAGLDITQKLQPFLVEDISPLAALRRKLKQLPLPSIPTSEMVSSLGMTILLLAGYAGWYNWRLTNETRQLELRLQSARQKQQDMARIRQEIETVRQRNAALAKINDVLSREIPFQQIPSDFLSRLEQNYIPGLVVRNYTCEADNLRIQGVVRAKMLGSTQRPADLVGQFVSRLEQAPGVASVSPSIREVLTGDSPFEVSVRLQNALPSASINLPPLSTLIEQEKSPKGNPQP